MKLIPNFFLQLFFVSSIFAQDNQVFSTCIRPITADSIKKLQEKTERQLQEKSFVEQTDYRIYKSNENNRIPLGYHHVEERDVLWEKRIEQIIPIKEKANHHFADVSNPLIMILLEGLRKNKIQAYHTHMKGFVPIENKGVLQNLRYTYVSEVYNPDTELMEPKVMCKEFNPEQLVAFKIEEVIYFDSRVSRMQNRIISITPMIEQYSLQGDFIGTIPLVKLSLEELRPLLSAQSAYLGFNETKQFSWDDVFHSRYFQSYIIKEGNLYDRRIQDYAQGQNALYEADKIREDIRNKELDFFSEN
jgi:gliding motility associated protien GldN